jgi:hypothetical protein
VFNPLPVFRGCSYFLFFPVHPLCFILSPASPKAVVVQIVGTKGRLLRFTIDL